MFARRALLVAAGALFLAFAWPLQGGFDNERSHYALVRALSTGTPELDRTRFETGDQVSADVTFWQGHTYSNKAPGLAFASVPTYEVARAVGVPDDGDPKRMLWALALVGSALPALVLLLVAGAVAERLEAGTGVVVAAVVGAATLVLPFATLFYSHVLAAALVTSSFALLFLNRRRPVAAAAAAGLLAGYAVTTEYPTALAAAALFGYSTASVPRARRALAFALGAAAGVAPLLLYNQWAFGSVTHFSWSGGTTHGRQWPSVELAGRAEPSLTTLLESLFGFSGLFVTAPVLALGAAGVVVLVRRRLRAEAALIGSCVLLFLLFNASFRSGFDSYSGGERYLVAVVPLLALPLACVVRGWPVTTGALALVSGLLAAALASSHVRAGAPAWLEPVFDAQFPETVLSFAGMTGTWTMLPFFALLAVAAAAAIQARPRVRISTGDTLVALAALAAWAIAAAAAPQTRDLGGAPKEYASYLGAAAALVLVAAAAALTRVRRQPSTRRSSASVERAA